MAKRGLPSGIGLRHDAHYVEELARTHRTIGRVIPIHQIEPNPEQPRTEIGDLSELSASIKEKGVLEPLLVKPNRQTGKWMIIAGERRWRAATLADLKEVPCIELDIDDQNVAEIALIENLQRKDLTIWEEADGLAALAEKFKYTHDEIARKISKSRSTVTELITIAGLPEGIREKCATAKINAKSSLLEIARQFDEASMHEFVDQLSGAPVNREAVRKKARSAATSGTFSGKHIKKFDVRETHVSEVTPNSLEHDPGGEFKYDTADGSASLTVSFRDQDFSAHDLTNVLEEALKAVKK